MAIIEVVMSSTDIFQEWKDNKFIVVKNIEQYKNLVVLTNISHWHQNYDELWVWCEKHNCKVQGMTIEMPDEQTMTLFVLRWS